MMYSRGSSAGGKKSLYSKLREQNDYNRPGMMMNILGRDIRHTFHGKENPLCVAHPLLVGILKERDRVVYQHGELVVPNESIVRGNHHVLVPTGQAADAMIKGGINHSQIHVTGLCIEPWAVQSAEADVESRLIRLRGSDALTGGFFSSGAEPSAHIERLVRAAVSAVQHGGCAHLFARENGRFMSLAAQLCKVAGLDYVLNPENGCHAKINIWTYRSRQDIDGTTQRFFRELDYFCAPAHERVNWAMGLGLPMFVAEPSIGTFAPLNAALVESAGIAKRIGTTYEAQMFGQQLLSLQKSGELAAMAEKGRNHNISGFSNAADFLKRI